MDLDEIERLLQMMKEHDVMEVELEIPEKGTKLRLRKSVPVVNSHPVLAPTLPAPIGMSPMPQMAVPAQFAPAPAPAADEPEEDRSNLTEVPSPMVGTFYQSASPESDRFVDVGDLIGAETVVCIIEAMKVMNEIKAEISGEVMEILVQNGEAVEYGQPLFLVRTG